jgi:predicted membrane channel-forming protein YqfA (hemolysin III family)
LATVTLGISTGVPILLALRPEIVEDHPVWWHRSRPYTRAEIISDGIVHGIGMVIAVAAGTSLLVIAGLRPAPAELPPLLVYVGSLLTVLLVSLAFNMAPVTPLKRLLAWSSDGCS